MPVQRSTAPSSLSAPPSLIVDLAFLSSLCFLNLLEQWTLPSYYLLSLGIRTEYLYWFVNISPKLPYVHIHTMYLHVRTPSVAHNVVVFNSNSSRICLIVPCDQEVAEANTIEVKRLEAVGTSSARSAVALASMYSRFQ